NEFEVDCWVTFTRESGINGDPALAFLVEAPVTWHSAFIITKTGQTLAIVGKYDQITVQETGAYDEVIGYVEGAKGPLQAFMKAVNPATIAINYSQDSEICDGLTHGMYLTLKSMLDEIDMGDRLVSAERIVSALRERKSLTELNAITQAIAHTQEIFALVTDFIAPGKTEKEVAAFMSAEVKKRGLETAWDAAVCPSVFTGPETAQAHYAPTDRVIERGQILNMDFGVKVDGYCSDMQRTFYVMEAGQDTVPEDVQKGFDTIVEAIEQCRLAIKPGGIGLDVDTLSRDVLAREGYDPFPHGLGHQVGRYAHDGTALLGPAWEKYAQKPFKKLEPNMVFTLEPRLTVPDRGVATIEEMVVVTDQGAEFLSDPQKALILIR
ncbi:MAG: aminopeptidase P family protein, partial [Planctomycetes bacterium]|nr:aminopeptidase P family protein [Planctomycetota bacterium]